MVVTMLNGIHAVFLDLDGSVYRGNTAIPHVGETIANLKSKGYKILYVTNNASRTREEYVEHFKKIGLQAEEDEFYTSAMATSAYMLQRYGSKRRIYVIGADSLKRELEDKGFTILSEEDAKKAEFVVLCLDTNVTYKRLCAACYAIQNGAKYIATNLDKTLPVEDGYRPGAGAISAAITTTTNVRPFLIGKPSKIIIEMALKYMGLSKDEVLLVGDKYETDIKVAKKLNMKSVLVLTGVTRAEQLKKVPEHMRPDYVIPSLNEIFSILK